MLTINKNGNRSGCWERKLPPVAERFWRKVKRGEPHECWPWVGSMCRNGYGRFWLTEKGKHVIAPRMAYELTYGELGSLNACHRCDNPPCCNPAHLFGGTQADNMGDCAAKGRTNAPKGEQHCWAKLTEAQVAEILRSRESHVATASKYGVKPATIQGIRAGRKWKHLKHGVSAERQKVFCT